MEAHLRDGEIVVGGDARQRFHDARGYGRPRAGNEIALDPVEAAHLLFRDDLESVDGEAFPAFVAGQSGDFGARFLVYADLRRRGFYLSPARDGWVADPPDADLVVFRRGESPPDGEVAYPLRAVGERTDVPAADLGDLVLAVADEEGEVTYLETDRPEPGGTSTFEPPRAEGTLLADRMFVADPPGDLYRRGFYGQPFGEEGSDDGSGPIQLSLVEAAYLEGEGALAVDEEAGAVVERGRAVEGDRFDRRLAAYGALRERGVVPKTGFKFGADFRTYAGVDDVDDLGHSEALVHVLGPDHVFAPRELALVVRLAAGVRKETVFALVDGRGSIEWRSAGRLTP